MEKSKKKPLGIAAIKKRIFEIIQIGYNQDFVSRGFDIFIVIMILLNLFVVFFETFDTAKPYTAMLGRIEFVTSIVFAIEYALRVWTADLLYPKSKAGKARLNFITSFYGIIDLLTFLPCFLPVVFPAGVVAFRVLRVVRIFKLFRINAYYDAFNVIADVLREKRDQIVSSVFIIILLIIASSLFMYSLEHEAQPEVFQNAFSGIWWSVSTLLTVGYGDIYPVTLAGRCVAIIMSFLGVGMVAIPTGIISAGFVEHYTKMKSLASYSEANIHFITISIGEAHSWTGKQIRELQCPKGLMIVVVIRDKEALLPAGDLRLLSGDKVVIGAEAYQDENGIYLQEIELKAGHPWIGDAIRDLDISRRTLIVMIRRKNKVIIPDGNTVLKLEDVVTYYTHKNKKR